MGRTLSISNVDAQTFQVLAGEQINENDLVQMGPDGKGCCVQGTNTAAVSKCTYGTAQTNAATGLIVAQTQISSIQTQGFYRQAVLRGIDGSIYTVTQGVSAANLSKYSAAGGLIAQVTVAGGVGYLNPQIAQLANGSIAVFLAMAGGVMYAAVYDQNLVSVSGGVFALTETATNAYYSAVALSGGGFAIVYQLALQSRLVTYNNVGSAVLAPTTVWTRTGTTNTQYHRMAQLSNGNLVIAVSSTNTAASIGLYHGIVTTGGASVLAFTNLDTVSATVIPELSVMPGYYAVARPNGTNQIARVFDNTGTLQGGGFSAATNIGVSNLTKLLNDGAAFWLIWPRSSDSKEVLTKLPTNGTGYVTTQLAGANFFNSPVDAFYENGFIVAVAAMATQCVMWAINSATGELVSGSGTLFGSAATTNGSYPSIIPGGDFSFLCLYDYANTASTNLYIGKYANTAIMGVAKTSGAAGQLVAVTGESGGHAINKLAGSASVAFDHSAATTTGNKGTLMNYGVTLKGI